MPGRLYDDITDPVLERCEGCGESALLCECDMDTDGRTCCRCCTHHHSLHTLKTYGLLEK